MCGRTNRTYVSKTGTYPVIKWFTVGTENLNVGQKSRKGQDSVAENKMPMKRVLWKENSY